MKIFIRIQIYGTLSTKCHLLHRVSLWGFFIQNSISFRNHRRLTIQFSLPPCPLDTNKTVMLQAVSGRVNCFEMPSGHMAGKKNQSSKILKHALPDNDPADHSGPAGPGITVMEKCKCTTDNYFGCLSICLLSHMYGFMITFYHPQKNDLGEFTESHNRATIIQQTLLISLIRYRLCNYRLSLQFQFSSIRITFYLIH